MPIIKTFDLEFILGNRSIALLAVGKAQPSNMDSLKNLFFLLNLYNLLSETKEYFSKVLQPPELFFLPLYL